MSRPDDRQDTTEPQGSLGGRRTLVDSGKERSVDGSNSGIIKKKVPTVSNRPSRLNQLDKKATLESGLMPASRAGGVLGQELL